MTVEQSSVATHFDQICFHWVNIDGSLVCSDRIPRLVVQPSLKNNLRKLTWLDLSHNLLTGTLTRAMLDIFYRNTTISIAHNNIRRIDIRMSVR